MADILILVIIAEGAILIGTIIGWNWLIDWVNFKIPALQFWLEAPPLLLRLTRLALAQFGVRVTIRFCVRGNRIATLTPNYEIPHLAVALQAIATRSGQGLQRNAVLP